MSLKEQLIGDLDIFFSEDDFAREVVYINGGKTIFAIVNYLQSPEIVAAGSANRVEVVVKKADMAGVKPMDELSFDDKTWIIEQVSKADDEVGLIIARSSEGMRY